MKSKITKCLTYLLVCSGIFCTATRSWAEADRIRVAKQFGISYLTLTVMEKKGLIEEQLKKAGLDAKVDWLRFSSGAAMNDALLSGNLDFAAGGIAPLLTIWAKTKNNIKVKGVVGLNMMPYYLVTTNKNIKSLKDITSKDKIALPAVRTSIQAVLLQLAAEKAFGPGQQNKLDVLTVSMGHPDSMAAMLGGISEIDAHFSTEPYQSMELADPKVHKVVDSYEVFGGRHSNNVVWATSKFVTENPKLTEAFIAAVEESEAFIKAHPEQAAALWIEAEHSKLSQADAVKIIRDPKNEWSTSPHGVEYLVKFMNKTGTISSDAASWKDVFFPNIHDAGGN